MLFSKHILAFFLVTLLGFASAIPTPGSDEEVQAVPVDGIEPVRTKGYRTGGMAWEHYYYQGRDWDLIEGKGCIRLKEGNNKISSFKVWSGYKCELYRNKYCLKSFPFMKSGKIQHQGPWEGNVPSGWNDKISSYKCYEV